MDDQTGRVLRVNEAVRRLRPCRVSPASAAAADDDDDDDAVLGRVC